MAKTTTLREAASHNADSFETRHALRLVKYNRAVDSIFRQAVKEAVSTVSADDGVSADKEFNFADHPLLQKKIDALLKRFSTNLELSVVNAIDSEWQFAEEKNDNLVKNTIETVLERLPSEKRIEYHTRNNAARDAFKRRKSNGLGLSQRVWNYTGQFKEELELALDLGISEGKSADEMSRDVRKFLKEPTKLFRRVRDKRGELRLSKAAKAYHPGQGVYRSSYKNAMRLTREEGNQAYRTADYLRWQKLDFVVGIEIHLSNNHTCNGKPFYDICDDLAGKYPKTFEFRSWHPQCRCYVTTILKTEEEMLRDEDGVDRGSVNEVKSLPKNFREWIANNKDRIKASEQRGTLPYFLADNFGRNDVLNAIDNWSKDVSDKEILTNDGQSDTFTVLTPNGTRFLGYNGDKKGRRAEKEANEMIDSAGSMFVELSPEQNANIQSLANIFGLRVKPMSFDEADSGAVNPKIKKSGPNKENCQSCVVVFECRRRGLDIATNPFDKNNKVFQQISENFELAWVNRKGAQPEPEKIDCANYATALKKLLDKTKMPGRYILGSNPKTNSGNKVDGHTVMLERLKNGQFFVYDPQLNIYWELSDFMSNLESLEVLRIDKLLVRPDVLKAIAH